MDKLAELEVGKYIKLKKPHPCGGLTWQVVSLGMDCRLKCLTCGRTVLLNRRELARRITTILEEAQ